MTRMHRSDSESLTSRPPSAWPIAAIGAANLFLAVGPLFVRLADTGPVAVGFWRIALAAPILLAVAVGRRDWPMASARSLWGVLILSGVVFALDLGSWHIGILRTTLANATLFGNSAILIFPIYGFLAARTWPNRWQATALVLAAIGGGLLLGQSAELSSQHLVGDLFCLLAGVLYSIYFVLMARVRRAMAPASTLALSTAASALPLLLLALALGEQVIPTNWTPLILIALFSQVIGQGLLIYAIGHLTPLIVGLALLIQPIVSATIGWIWFGERLGAADLTGAALVAVALVLVRRPERPAKVALASEPAGPRSVA